MSTDTIITNTAAAPPTGVCIPLDICNLALAKLGESPIPAISPDGTPAARLCHLHYHPVRREILCSHRWSFATGLTTLSPLDGPDSETGKPHPLPTDCLRVLKVGCPRWTLRGRCIYCSADKVQLLYIRDEEDTSLYEPLFIEAFATRLACKLCISLTSSTTAREALTREYHRIALPQAAHFNAVQNESNDSDPLHRRFNKHGIL